MTDTEKWKARARDIVCAEIMMSSHITGDAVAWLEAEIAAALAGAAADEREACKEIAKRFCGDVATAIEIAIRAREQKP